MIEKRKLQVFVSSTYIDLKEERQAAVQAILTAGHIPAGMELFSAGDQSQMDVIKRWIDDSDVFLLILGRRYGSIEPSSNKSYTHLEYEYALKQNKAHFVIAIEQALFDQEIKNPEAKLNFEDLLSLQRFRSDACSGKNVAFWKNPGEVREKIKDSLFGDFSRREELTGWIRGDQAVNTEELARLAKENSELRKQVKDLSSKLANNQAIFDGLTYKDMYQNLNELKLDFDSYNPPIEKKPQKILQEISTAFGDSEVSFLHCFWSMRNLFGRPNLSWYLYQSILEDILKFGLFEFEKNNEGNRTYIKLSECGRNFLNCLIKDKKNNLDANKFALSKEDSIQIPIISGIL